MLDFIFDFCALYANVVGITDVIVVYNQQVTADQTTTHVNIKLAVSRV